MEADLLQSLSVLLLLLGLVLGLIAALVSRGVGGRRRMRRRTRDQGGTGTGSDKEPTPDTVAVPGLQVSTEGPFNDSDVDRALERAITHLQDEDPQGQGIFQDAVKELSEHPIEAAQAVARIDQQVPTAYPLRWALYYVLAEMQHPDTIEPLIAAAIATCDLPADESACDVPVDGAVLVSVMAVEGIERLLSGGRLLPVDRQRASDGLRQVIHRQTHRGVLLAASRALLPLISDEERIEIAREIAQKVSEIEEELILTLKEATAEDLISPLPEPPGAGGYS